MTADRKRPLRVIQWGTGNAGRKALSGILRHPELELVGVHAHSPAQVGKDAAELCDWPKPTGIRASDDAAALLALDADCVCYTAQGETRIRETVDELCRIGARDQARPLKSTCPVARAALKPASTFRFTPLM
jgi:4-hydroxy-tetrahydrodipicolinate reductase